MTGSRVKASRLALVELAALAVSTPMRIRLRRGRRYVLLLSRMSPSVRSIIEPAMSPTDVYPTRHGIAVDANLVRALHARLERGTVEEPPPQAVPPSAAKLVTKPRSGPVMAAFDAAEALDSEEGLVEGDIQQSARPEPRLDLTPSIPEPLRWTIVDRQVVEERVADRTINRNSERYRLFEKLAHRPVRRLPVPAATEFASLDALTKAFPNFQAVVEDISTHLLFRQALGLPIELPPMLLNGPPGIGKTEFARRLATALNLHLVMRSFAEMSASFVLTGSHRSWTGSAPGIVAKAIADLPDGTLPLILIDEIDKSHRHANHPPEQALLGLLEPSTAERFHDECLDLPIDARPIVWVMTCNELNDVSAPIRSRLRIFDIAAPTKAQMPAVVRSVDLAIRERTPAIGSVFRPLSNQIVAVLAETNPRALYRLLQRIYAVAGKRIANGTSPIRITTSHVQVAKQAIETRTTAQFGFAKG